jgi:hypothetical protein
MRRILVDRARQKQAARHGGGRRRVPLREHHRFTESPDDLLGLDEALTRFAAKEPISKTLLAAAIRCNVWFSALRGASLAHSARTEPMVMRASAPNRFDLCASRRAATCTGVATAANRA